MTISYFQEELEAIYGVRAPNVLDFLVDREAARRSGAEEPRAPELLLVRESDDGVELGLFLDEDVKRASERTDPHDPRPLLAAPSALPRLACAAEGVSHFVYLATRAAEGRPVSLLELEIQAEVDKFALLLLHLWRRGLRKLSPALRRRLYDRVRYHSCLGADALERYRLANRLGGGYARWLEDEFVHEADVEGLLRELRASYRLGGGEKIGYLGARAT